MALVDLYRRSVDGFVDRVRKVRPDQWAEPTPCAEWDVRNPGQPHRVRGPMVRTAL